MPNQQYKVSRYESQALNLNKDMLTTGSTLITQGRMLTTASGYLQHATTTTTLPLWGIAMEGKLAATTTTDPVLIDLVDDNALLRWTVDTGTTTQAMVGTTCDIATGGGLDVGTDTYHHVRIVSTTAFNPVGTVSASNPIDILVRINKGYVSSTAVTNA
jgi:hypothetical protein